MIKDDDQRRDSSPVPGFVRDPLANRAAVLAARQRPMSERLELAISWNLAASQLRNSIAAADFAKREH